MCVCTGCARAEQGCCGRRRTSPSLSQSRRVHCALLSSCTCAVCEPARSYTQARPVAPTQHSSVPEAFQAAHTRAAAAPLGGGTVKRLRSGICRKECAPARPLRWSEGGTIGCPHPPPQKNSDVFYAPACLREPPKVRHTRTPFAACLLLLHLPPFCFTLLLQRSAHTHTSLCVSRASCRPVPNSLARLAQWRTGSPPPRRGRRSRSLS